MKKYIIALFYIFLSSLCFAASPVPEVNKVQGSNSTLSGKVDNGVRVVEVQASRYKFSPDPIVVKQGEKVRLVLTSVDVAHGLAIAEFKVRLTCDIGKTDIVEFVADKKGIFVVRCNVYCGPGHTHMQASFVVK